MIRKLVCIQGLGFVGAAMAVAVAAARDKGEPIYDVVGVDLPTEQGLERISSVNSGRFPFATADDQLTEAAHQAHRIGNLRATADPECYDEADIIIVDVNFDVDLVRKSVDFDHFRAAIDTFASRMKPSALVVIESTLPPGTCARVVAPQLNAAFVKRGIPEDSFLLAHSYERVMPGANYLSSITNHWRVFSGHTPEAARRCREFLSSIINVRDFPLTELHSTTASEIAKILENSYRAVNIAFMEEWGRFAERAGVDLFQVIDAIRMRPTHSNIRQPGFGVGGYCLTKDPLLASIAAQSIFGIEDLSFHFSESAVEINQRMPLVSLDRIETMLGGTLKDKLLLIMGVSYREDVADTRHSPAATFAIEAKRRGARISACDPMVRQWPELGIAVVSDLSEVPEVDGVIFAVPHQSFRKINMKQWLSRRRPTVLDANNVLTDKQREAIISAGCRFASIGRGN